MFELTIPVFNEERTLEDNILTALKFIKRNITTHTKIVIANNGSTDHTDEIARKLEKEHPEIDYIKLPKKGVGLALRTSWLQSKADIVGYMDLDLSTDLKHLKEAYTLLVEKDYDIVNGSRLLKNSQVRGRTRLRNMTSRTFNVFVRLLLGVNLTDGMCGFKFFRREVAIDLINTGINTDGWFFSTEILVKALWSGKALIELPVEWSDDRESKVNIVKLSKKYMYEILRMRWEMHDFIKMCRK